MDRNQGVKISSLHILVVEDDRFLANIYETKLKLEGFIVAVAGDGKQGLELARRLMPDIILLDILLPKMSGFHVLSELKKDAKTKKIPVILLTNLSQKEDIDRGLQLGAADYLIKAHFLPSEVIEKIKEVLGRDKV